MPKITNESYRKFREKGLIDIMHPPEFHKNLDKMRVANNNAASMELYHYMILLYWSGRRPTEILKLKPKDITLQGRFVSIMFETLKKGRATTFYFSTTKVPDILKVYKWVKMRPPDSLLFPILTGHAKPLVKWKSKTGKPHEKVYTDTSYKLRYYTKKYFKVPPYFFRHNRFSDMMLKGAAPQDIKHAKGSKDLRSVEPYLHLSTRAAKQTAKFIK